MSPHTRMADKLAHSLALFRLFRRAGNGLRWSARHAVRIAFDFRP